MTDRPQVDVSGDAPIVWLASYPKSGNTWLRLLVANVLSETTEPVDINDIDTGGFVASDRQQYEEFGLVPASELPPAAVYSTRRALIVDACRSRAKATYVKVHDAYVDGVAGVPMFPASVARSVLYIARNPLAVSISFAHHFGIEIDTAIERMAGRPGQVIAPPRFQLPQQPVSWSDHVTSWLDQTDVPLSIVRYEDLVAAPVDTFARLAPDIGLVVDRAAVRAAVEHSAFKRLQQQEREHSFRERLRDGEPFFRSGRVDEWKDVLTQSQVDRIWQTHQLAMQRLGYTR